MPNAVTATPRLTTRFADLEARLVAMDSDFHQWEANNNYPSPSVSSTLSKLAKDLSNATEALRSDDRFAPRAEPLLQRLRRDVRFVAFQAGQTSVMADVNSAFGTGWNEIDPIKDVREALALLLENAPLRATSRKRT